MATKRLFFLVPLMLLTLVGCYQQASDDLDALPQSVSVVGTPTISSQTVIITPDLTADLTADITEETPIVVAQDATATLEDLPLMTATETSTPSITPTITNTPTTTSTPTITPIGELSTATPTETPTTTTTALSQPLSVTEGTPTPLFNELATSTPTPTLTFTLTPTVTFTLTPTSTSTTAPTATLTITPDVLTPSVPIGPSAISTPTPAPTNEPLITPTDLAIVQNQATATPRPECEYEVVSGDTLFRIAQKLDVSLADLRAANPPVANTDIIRVGQRLIIPDCEEEATTNISRPANVATSTPSGGGISVVVPADGTSQDRGILSTNQEYVVQAGDTLSQIARRFNTTVDAIVRANNLNNPNSLSVGQRLVIPSATQP